MQTTQNKTLGSSDFQNQKLFHVNNFKKYVVVTSVIHNLTINNKNIIKKTLNALQYTQSNLMFNKSLKNSYAITELLNR